MAADRDALGALHVALATAFADILNNGVKVTDDEGKLVSVTAPPAYLNVVRQFLKDNGIEAATAPPGSALGNVVSALPFAGSDHPANQTH